MKAPLIRCEVCQALANATVLITKPARYLDDLSKNKFNFCVVHSIEYGKIGIKNFCDKYPKLVTVLKKKGFPDLITWRQVEKERCTRELVW